jgi:SAM-dependent methyltransferase
MERVTDFITLWKELVEKQGPFWNRDKRSENNQDKWQDRARVFYQRVTERWKRPDPHRDFIISVIKAYGSDATLLDIGAGTGAWAILLSRYVRKVTAIEPSAEMREILIENLERESITNVEIVDRFWPIQGIELHDFTLASHSVYGCEDIRGFITAMNEATSKMCFMLLRAPDHNGIMAMAAKRIWGHPYDSPNFQVAYNAMLQMDMFPNVLMENKGMWPGWTNTSFDEAFDRIRLRFGLDKDSEHERYLHALLKARLRELDGKIVWPSEVRTALLYWNTGNEKE